MSHIRTNARIFVATVLAIPANQAAEGIVCLGETAHQARYGSVPVMWREQGLLAPKAQPILTLF